MKILFFFLPEFLMKNKNLIDASENGDLKLVQQLLTNKKININCTDISIQKYQ